MGYVHGVVESDRTESLSLSLSFVLEHFTKSQVGSCKQTQKNSGQWLDTQEPTSFLA